MTRRRIEIKKIEKNDYLKTSYTKRRYGLFNKAKKLWEDSGAQVAVITFSPGGKAFVSDHVSVDSIIDPIIADYNKIVRSSGSSQISHENGTHVKLEKAPTSSSSATATASAALTSSSSQEVVEEEQEGCPCNWWVMRLEDMDLDTDELKRYKASLEALKKNVATRLEDMKTRKARTIDFLRLFDSR